MKRLLLLFTIFLCCSFAYAQENEEDYVLFYLQSNGTFLNESGEKFTVINYEGKTADELYNMVKNNVMSAYNDPKSVMSENEGQVINIHGFAEKIWERGVYYGGNYKLTFRFKDNKIRVDAPSIDNKLVRTEKITRWDAGFPTTLSFSECAYKCCKKSSDKNEKKKNKIENVVNVPINYLLGKIKTKNNSSGTASDDNW